MVKVDFHIHTADDPFDLIPYTTRQAIDRGAEQGFSALALTLHDRQLDIRPLESYARERGIVLIPGVERTIRGRHVLLINFPAAAESIGSFDELAALKRQNPQGLVIAPHPFFPHLNCLRGLVNEYADLFDAVEINGFWARALNFNRGAVEWAQKHGKPVVGNSDAHRIHLIGMTFSLVDADPHPDAICAAVREGRLETRSTPLSTLRAAQYLLVLLRGARAVPLVDPSTAVA
ncbi:MAG TPA: PHP domain-containing protein [Vicinamibacterales bacterium]|jgi:hypothetical protein